MRRRLRWRWVRAMAMRLARRHYMFSFTLIALVLAGAGAMGYFDGDDGRRPTTATGVVAPTRTPAPTVNPLLTPVPFIPADPLTVTYYLVDSEREKEAYEVVEDGMIFREILEKDAIEVILIRNEAEQAEADRILAEAELLAEESGFILVVRDLRDE